MFTQYCSIFFYILAIVAQSLAAAYAVNLFYRASLYRLASGALAVGFCLMIGRRIAPLLQFYIDGRYNLFDAFLALCISVLLFIGLHQIKKIILDLQEKNFILDRDSKVDFLTQALSRYETFSRAEIEIERALRNQKPVTFLMLDIDLFKKINDHYGHSIGDVVLQNLTKICQAELRAIDVFGRVGGEEFFVVLPEASDAKALEVAERLRNKIAITPCAAIGGESIMISVSIGLACFDPINNNNRDVATILRMYYKRADQAMYLAKSNGRNRCQVWTMMDENA